MKTLFKGFTKKPSIKWAQSEPTQARTSLSKLLKEVSQWQLAYPTLALSEQPVYPLGQALQSVVATHLVALKKRFSWREDPTSEWQSESGLLSKRQKFILS